MRTSLLDEGDQGNWIRLKGLIPDNNGHLELTLGGVGVNQGLSGFQLIDATADPGDVTPPAPNPMTWATVPTDASETTITMTATSATDLNGVEYFFTETSGKPGGTSSVDWQNGPTYVDTGLTPGTTYTYTVTARDRSVGQNRTTVSAARSAATKPADLNPPPTPAFTAGPVATSIGSITMNASTVADPEGNGVEYYFTETSGNPGASNSGWLSIPTFTDSGLTPGKTYSYTVKSRDMSLAMNQSTPSAASTASTPAAAAGEVAWSTAQNITSPLDIVTTGTLVASRTGDDSSGILTVNGVDFTEGKILNNSGALNDTCPDTGAGAEEEALEFLLDRISFNGSSFEITDLTPGSKYLIQLFLCDYRVANRSMAITGPGASATATLISNPPGAFGQTVVGTFVASATNQIFDITALSGGVTHLNSYQVRFVPDTTAPKITSFTAVGVGLWELRLKGNPSTAYEFRSTPDLNFSPGTPVTNLVQGNPATDPGDVGGLNNSQLTTDATGVGVARVALSGPRHFIRGQKRP